MSLPSASIEPPLQDAPSVEPWAQDGVYDLRLGLAEPELSQSGPQADLWRASLACDKPAMIAAMAAGADPALATSHGVTAFMLVSVKGLISCEQLAGGKNAYIQDSDDPVDAWGRSRREWARLARIETKDRQPPQNDEQARNLLQALSTSEEPAAQARLDRLLAFWGPRAKHAGWMRMALRSCAQSGKPKPLATLIELGCPVGLAPLPGESSLATAFNSTSMMLAAESGSVECARLLRAAGAEVNESGSNGQGPVMVALSKGHFDCAKELVNLGADVNRRDAERRVPLLNLGLAGKVEAMAVALELGADPGARRSRRDPRRIVDLLEQSKHPEAGMALRSWIEREALSDVAGSLLKSKPKHHRARL